MKKSLPLKINHLQYNNLLLELQNNMVKKSFNMKMSILFSNKLDLFVTMSQLKIKLGVFLCNKVDWSRVFVI